MPTTSQSRRTDAPGAPKHRAATGMKGHLRSQTKPGFSQTTLSHFEAHPRPPTARLSDKDRSAPLLFWGGQRHTTEAPRCYTPPPQLDPTLLRSGPPRTPPSSAYLLCSDALAESGT